MLNGESIIDLQWIHEHDYEEANYNSHLTRHIDFPVPWSDAHPPGIQTVAGSILRSGKTFFCED